MSEDSPEALRRRHPAWSIWWGPATGRWLAAPLWNAPLSGLREGDDLEQLEQSIIFAERRKGQST